MLARATGVKNPTVGWGGGIQHDSCDLRIKVILLDRDGSVGPRDSAIRRSESITDGVGQRQSVAVILIRGRQLDSNVRPRVRVECSTGLEIALIGAIEYSWNHSGAVRLCRDHVAVGGNALGHRSCDRDFKVQLSVRSNRLISLPILPLGRICAGCGTPLIRVRVATCQLLVRRPIQKWLNKVLIHDILAGRIILDTNPERKLFVSTACGISAGSSRRDEGVRRFDNVDTRCSRASVEHVTELVRAGPFCGACHSGRREESGSGDGTHLEDRRLMQTRLFKVERRNERIRK